MCISTIVEYPKVAKFKFKSPKPFVVPSKSTPFVTEEAPVPQPI